jgi:phage shock protein PspC (stress-responsive transcriptional regulator)
MDKTISINIGGTLFQVDEEAFYKLRDYIQAISNRLRNVPGGNETIEDIESRIAEIFRSQKGLAGVITIQNVQDMISVIGKPEEFDSEPEKPFTHDEKIAKRLYRNPDDSVISGVCGGLGAYFNTDPVLFRILFVIFTLFFAIGLFIYLVLWIAVPSANTEAKKREMYGGSFSKLYESNSSRSGLNEIFHAFGRVFYLIFRIFFILIGLALLLTGFFVLLSYILVFFVKYPGIFNGDEMNFTLNYLPDALRYVFNEKAVPWITILTSIAVILPCLAFMYWGIKMILWLKVRDGAYNLVAFILWIACLAVLSIILFNQGISFSESSSTTARNILPANTDSIFVCTSRKIEDLKHGNKVSIYDNRSTVALIDSTGSIHIKPQISININEEGPSGISVRKGASARTHGQATDKAETILFNYEFRKDTLMLDNYFTIPSGEKWSADYVKIYMDLPENTVLYFDKEAAEMLHNVHPSDGWNRHYHHGESEDMGGRYWVLTKHGLRESR